MGKNVGLKSSQDLQMGGNVPSWQNLGPRFSNGSLHENLRAARQISCAASLTRKIVKHSNKNAHTICMAVTAMQR